MAEDLNEDRDEDLDEDQEENVVNKKGLGGLFSQFSKPFWVVNSLELLERGAYYALMAVLAQHMVQNLHFTESITGVVVAIFMVCLYFLPFIFGAIADKVGFKTMLIFNFCLMFTGYVLIGVVSATEHFLISIVILGIGAGGFKPIISSTIANITKSEQRNLAYAVYYWMINCGAFFFPLSFGLYFTTVPDPASLYRYIFFFSAAFVIVNLTITFFLYNNPKEPESEKDIRKVFANAAIVVKDYKFFSLLIIYSGFWFMFAMNHTFLPLYMLNFHIMPAWFTPLLLATINPGTIIVVGPFLAKYMEKLPSLQMMILGSVIFMIGLLIVGMVPTPTGLFVGIIIFSTGEFITHPNFISYVSKIAPKERVTVYLGYIFIATGIGLVLGSLCGGVLYENIARNMERPKLFWGIVISVGLFSTFFLMFYNMFYSKKRSKEETGIDLEMIPKKKSILENKLTMMIPLICIPILLFGAQSAGIDAFYALEEEEVEIPPIYTINEVTDSRSDYLTENSQEVVDIEVPEENYRLIWFNATVTWRDETTNYMQGTNEPDEFKVTIIAPNSEEKQSDFSFNPQGGEGSVEVSFGLDYEEAGFRDNYLGTWTVIVEAGQCGDDSAFFPIGGIRTTSDNGNEWTLEYKYEYYEKVEE